MVQTSMTLFQSIMILFNQDNQHVLIVNRGKVFTIKKIKRDLLQLIY